MAKRTKPATQQPIKVGFLSVYLKEHSIGKVLGPVIAMLGSTGKFVVTMYTMDQENVPDTHHAKETEATAFFASHVKQFGGAHVHLSQDVSLAKAQLVEDSLDVLVSACSRQCG
jgi:hypothetical protein